MTKTEWREWASEWDRLAESANIPEIARACRRFAEQASYAANHGEDEAKRRFGEN